MNSHESPRLYSWTVIAPEEGSAALGAVGVTNDRTRALASLGDALRDAPAGARGLVHRVLLSLINPGYMYESLEARCRYDPDSGTVVWDQLPPPSTWANLRPLITDRPETIRDAFPPEAMAAGLADLEAEQGRL
jgi:hypothetical protein